MERSEGGGKWDNCNSIINKYIKENEEQVKNNKNSFIVKKKKEQSNNSQQRVGRGQWGEGLTGTTIKDKIKGEGRGGAAMWVWLGWGGGMGRKCRQL